MTKNDLIFGNSIKQRLIRHLALWVCLCLYFLIVNFYPKSISEFFIASTYRQAFQKLIYVPISIQSVYVSIYFLLPRFLLKEKYFYFFISLFFLVCINITCAFLLTKWLVYLTQETPFEQQPVNLRVFQPIMYGLGLSMAASGIATILRLLKIDYLKQKENERLQKQKINTELQLIKTNIQPHFLSDALKYISSLLRNESVESPGIILNLSELLSYILYDNDKEQVSVLQELKMVKEYIKLENEIHVDSLFVSLEEEGEFQKMRVAPLLFLSLIQNTCEQLAALPYQILTIFINIKVKNNQLIFNLKSDGQSNKSVHNRNGYKNGLSQALDRIQLLYPHHHQLETYSENEHVSISLVLESGALYARSLTEQKESQ